MVIWIGEDVMLENETLPEEVEGVVLLLTPRLLSAARYSQGIWPLRRWIGCPNDFQPANRILVGAQQAEWEMPSNLGRGRHQQGGRAARPQQRSATKVTFSLVWTKTYCIHPLYHEPGLIQENFHGFRNAAQKKLLDELGIALPPPFLLVRFDAL